MSSRREIAITIKGNVGGSGRNERNESIFEGDSSSAISNEETARQALNTYTEAGNNKQMGGKAAAAAVALYALEEVKNVIVQYASVSWNRYLDMKEDYIAQNNMNALKANINMAKSYASSTIKGAAIGGIVGAAIGIGANVAKRAISFNATMEKYYDQNNAMNAQTNFSRVRMGLIDGGRGTEN